jgi:hypothetical protein
MVNEMPRYTGMIEVGDVLVTREGPWWASGAIRLGAWLTDRPSVCNHVIVAHHQDAQGVLWGIEGRPGGVGWRDLSEPLRWPLTNANTQQPKTNEQRLMIATAMEGLFATPYDWNAIKAHVREALRLWEPHGPVEWKDHEAPGHVVCSSLADWAYEEVGLPNPGGDLITRMTTPGDWDRFIMDKEWRS